MTCAQASKFTGRFQRNKYTSQHAGFTLLELLIDIILIGIVSIGLLERLLYYQEYAEKTVMEVTIRNIRNGLQLRVADLMMHDKMKDVGGLLNENPITWLEMPPPNYLGELKAPQKNTLSKGNWYFDSERKELTYLPDHCRFFESESDGRKEVRYRTIAIKYSQGRNNDQLLKPEGIALHLVNPYKWNLTIK